MTGRVIDADITKGDAGVLIEFQNQRRVEVLVRPRQIHRIRTPNACNVRANVHRMIEVVAHAAGHQGFNQRRPQHRLPVLVPFQRNITITNIDMRRVKTLLKGLGLRTFHVKCSCTASHDAKPDFW